LSEIGVPVAQVLGFLKGAWRRKAIDLRRFNGTRGIMFILAGVPIHDTGGGSRGAQIALEFLRQNYLVFYIHKFETYESVNLGLEIRHPNLVIYRLSDFSWEKLAGEFSELISAKPSGALIEFPLKDFMSLINQLQSAQTVIAYDLLDDWDTQLGSTWYEKEIEDRIIASADILIATATILAQRLERIAAKPVSLLPNAVNLRLFDFRRAYPRPADLPAGKFVVTYIGALWGEWFDWDLLIQLARSYPEAAVVVIGDYRGQCPEILPNLHFLGLKPQKSLPAYLACTSLAIIPWKVNEITRATSPLKLYEYLAMHVPVVVPNLPLLNNIPHVYLSKNKSEFIDQVKVAVSSQVSESEIEEFIVSHSWEFRVKQIIQLMDFDE
jgi:glycosyltransferase involved in cell wall biosynthesis